MGCLPTPPRTAQPATRRGSLRRTRASGSRRASPRPTAPCDPGRPRGRDHHASPASRVHRSSTRPVRPTMRDACPPIVDHAASRHKYPFSSVSNFEPGAQLAKRAGAPAVIMGESGVVVTYAELDARSKQLAQLFHAAGLRAGDHLAVMLENHPRYFEVAWGAQRTGLYTTPVNWHLNAEEAGYIIEDCGATAFITSYALADVAA